MVEIQKIIEEIRISLQADGADVEFVSLKNDNTVVLKVTGKSKGCELLGIPLAEALKTYICRANSQITTVETI